MAVDYERIYAEEAEAYDRLVAAEDVEGNLLHAIGDVQALAGASVAEVGVGTGRVTRLLVSAGVASIRGVDTSETMLAVARGHLEREAPPGGGCDWELVTAPAARLPFGDGWADLAIAGWVFGHLTQWFEADWRTPLEAALTEMARVTRPGGAQMVIETLGTGQAEPAAPTALLAAYYTALEQDFGFERRWMRTDFVFDSSADAESLCRLFFGDAMGDQVRASGSRRVTECTGLWWRRAAQI